MLPKTIYRFSEIPIKSPMAFFTELEQKKNHNLYGNTKTLNCQSNLEKERWSWRKQTPWLEIILQSYNHQDSRALVWKQKYRPMEQDRKPRDKPMHLWAPYLWQRRQEYTMQKRQPLQQVVMGKLNSYVFCFVFLMKLEHFLTPYTKINSKWIKNLNVSLETIKLLEETMGSIPFDINCSKILSDTPIIMEIKTKINR